MSKTTPQEVEARKPSRSELKKMMERDAKAFYRRYTAGQRLPDEELGLMTSFGVAIYDAVFDAGVQFASGQWKEIRSAEDLPKERGMYVVRSRKCQAYPEMCLFTLNNEGMTNLWMTSILAYVSKPISTYQGPPAETSNAGSAPLPDDDIPF